MHVMLMLTNQLLEISSLMGIITRAVTNFSSKREIVKSRRGIKKVWCPGHRLLLRRGGGGGEGGRGGGTVEVKGLGKHKNCS